MNENSTIALWEQEIEENPMHSNYGFFQENSMSINFLMESIDMDYKYCEMFGIHEGVMSTIKEKILSAIGKLIEWVKGLIEKITNFFKGGAISAKRVEANFKGVKATGESTFLFEDASEEKIKECNEAIYKYLQDNSPVYVFRQGNAVPGFDEIEELENDFVKALNSKDIDDIWSNLDGRLNNRFNGNLDEYFKEQVDTYSKSPLSANTDYVKNGMKYFMSDFIRIDKYIESAPKKLDKIKKLLNMAEDNIKRIEIKEENKAKYRIYSKFIKELTAMQKIINKSLSELLKTRRVIAHISMMVYKCNNMSTENTYAAKYDSE